jgi:hypothetical protein
MDNVHISTHFFFVPNRLIWNNWERFNGEQATSKVIFTLTGALNIIIRLRIRTIIDRNSEGRLKVFITKPIVEDKIMRTEWKGGYILPIFVDEVLPGDTFNCRLTAFGRLSTPIFPIMDNVHISTHFFFVPNRLVWICWGNSTGNMNKFMKITSSNSLIRSKERSRVELGFRIVQSIHN